MARVIIMAVLLPVQQRPIHRVRLAPLAMRPVVEHKLAADVLILKTAERIVAAGRRARLTVMAFAPDQNIRAPTPARGTMASRCQVYSFGPGEFQLFNLLPTIKLKTQSNYRPPVEPPATFHSFFVSFLFYTNFPTRQTCCASDTALKITLLVSTWLQLQQSNHRQMTFSFNFPLELFAKFTSSRCYWRM